METNGTSHERIAELEYVDQATFKTDRITRVALHDSLKSKQTVAFVLDNAGDKVYVGPRENQYGTKYVQTYSDGIWKDNLLALPQYY